MNLDALKISVMSLIQNGKEIISGKEDEMFLREYVDLYMKTKAYFKDISNVEVRFLSYYNRLPDLEYKKFSNPIYLFKSYLYENVKLGKLWSRGVYASELFPDVDPYPARNRYRIALNHNVSVINDILIEFITTEIAK